MKIEWSANWDDDLGGSTATAHRDPMLKKIADKVKFEFEQTFMFYLPRICEHCLNPSCAASCPSGAIYKREEDGIVLVDQDKCRGWRMCVSGCPYKKIYFNHRTGKAEKCTFCFPRIEVGLPTVCSETCVGRLRYIGLMLYDADKVLEAASTTDDQGLYEAQRDVFLDPFDPEVIREAEKAGIARDWIDAAQRSPIYALINTYKVALPLHPEYRTMPMVWYIPPLSPVVDVVAETGEDAEDKGNLFAAIDALRIPVEYLAELFTAGDVAPVDAVLKKLAAMRCYMRDINMGRDPDGSIPAAVGMSEEDMYDMYRLLAIAKYDERYVIPPAHAEQAHSLEELATECSVSEYGGGQQDLFGEGSGAPTPIAVENFQMLQDRQTSDSLAGPENKGARVNLLNWDGKGSPPGLFPPKGDGLVSGRRPKPALPPDQLTIVWQSVSLLLDYPDEDAARAGRAAPVRLAAPADRDRRLDPRLPRPPRVHAAAGAPGRLRRDLRHPPTLQPVPDLLRARRHPQARDGAAALQADLPARPGSSSTTRSCPTTCASSSSSPPPSTRSCGRDLMLDHRAGLELLRLSLRDLGSPWAQPGRRGHRHPAAAARRRARRRTPARRRGPARGGGRAGAVRRPAVQPRRRRGAGRDDPAAHAVLPGSPRDERVPLRRRPLRLPDDLRRRAPVALPLRQVRLDHPVLPALREPAAAHRQPAVPLRDARRRRRPRHRPAGAAVVDRRGRASASTPTTWWPSPAVSLAGVMTVVGMAILIYRRRTVGPVFSATTPHGQGDVRLPGRR